MLITTKEKSPDYQRRFENAEIRVQAKRVGLWSEKIQIPPEKWRRGLRTAEQPCDNCTKLCSPITSHFDGCIDGYKTKTARNGRVFVVAGGEGGIRTHGTLQYA
jgi:hypothetical protein